MSNEEAPRAIRFPEPGEPYNPAIHKLPPLEIAGSGQDSRQRRGGHAVTAADAASTEGANSGNAR